MADRLSEEQVRRIVREELAAQAPMIANAVRNRVAIDLRHREQRR